MVVDEAWQATYADLGALGAFAPQVVCVGDPGQIDPVVTGATRRWADTPTGPHLPAPVALLAAHHDAVSVVTAAAHLAARTGHDRAHPAGVLPRPALHQPPPSRVPERP